MTRRARAAALAIAALALAGCGDDTLDIDDYNVTCVNSADCVAVYIGDVCDCEDRCPNAAINRASYVSYKEDEEAASCGLSTRCDLPESCPPIAMLCINQRCQVPETSGQGDDGGLDR